MKRILQISFCLLYCVTAYAQSVSDDYARARNALQHYRLDSSLVFIDKSIRYHSTNHNFDSLALTLALEAQLMWEKENTAKAIQKAEASMDAVLKKLSAKSIGRVALNAIAGSLYASKYKFDSATIYYNQALKAADTLRPQLPLVTLYMNLCRMEMLKENIGKADLYYNKAYNTLQTINGGDELTLIDLLISQTQYLIVGGNYNKALQSALKAEELIKKHYRADNPKVAKNYANLSSISYYLSRYEEALIYRQQALNVYLKTNMLDINNNASFYATYYNMGQLYYYLNEHSLAVNYLQKALNIGTNIYGRQSLGMVNILIQFGTAQQKLRKFDLAKTYFEEAYQIQKLLNPTDYSALAYIEGFYGDMFADEKKYDSAALYYNRAIENYRSVDEAVSYYSLYTGANLSVVYSETGNTAAALNIQKDVLNKFRNNFPTLKQPVIEFLDNIAKTYLKAGKLDSAVLFSDSTILLQTELKALPDAPSNWIKKLPFSFKVSEHVNVRLEILYELYEQSKNKSYLSQILGIVNTYSIYISENIYKLRTQGSLIEQSEVNKSIYAVGIDACWQLSIIENNQQYIEKAFMFSEQSKALLLRLASNSFMVDDAMENENTIIKKDLNFRKQISSLNEQYMNAETATDSLLRLMTITIESYRLFQDSLKKNDNLYFNKRYAIDTYPLGKIREALLTDGSTLIEFALTERHLYTFVITKDSIFAKQSNKDLIKSIPVLQDPQALSAIAFRDSAYKLYNSLIKPIEPHFTTKKLIIVPDADLYYLNFETLLTDNNGVNFSSFNYLLHKYTISYLLSANVAVQLKTQISQEKRKDKVLLFAPVFTDAMKQVYKNLVYSAQKDSSYFLLYRQPFALQAVQNIYNLMSSDMFLEHEALESNFKQASSQYKILHLGTHALVNDMDPLQSKLFFAKSSDALSSDDGNLHAYEIYSMQLRAELAVLTACETGSGTIHSGEGIMSLAHSFMFAGCPSVIMSLWKIDEKTNAQIITDFYKYLQQGNSKSEALRKAKLKFIESNTNELANPFYWGGLCVIGDDAALYSNSVKWYYWIAGIGVVLFLTLFASKKLKFLSSK